MYVGFKRMYIQPLTAENKADGDVIVIEGKQNQGATTTAEITGLSKEATKVAGSDVVYYISRKGVGDVKSDFGVLDMPIDAEDRILGHTVSESGISYIGSDTEAPYCSVLLESQDAEGDKAELGFFRGTFAKDKENLNTLDPSETYKPEAETYTFSASASDQEGAQNGEYVARYAGKDEDPAFEEMETQLLIDKTKAATQPAGNGTTEKIVAPTGVDAKINDDNSVTVTWNASAGAKAYVIHYGNANKTGKDETLMGYSETPSWTLAAADVPAHVAGDTITFNVMAYPKVGVGINDVGKAAYLNTAEVTGSAWADDAVVTFA